MNIEELKHNYTSINFCDKCKNIENNNTAYVKQPN